jgi:hypothetical protein
LCETARQAQTAQQHGADSDQAAGNCHLERSASLASSVIYKSRARSRKIPAMRKAYMQFQKILSISLGADVSRQEGCGGQFPRQNSLNRHLQLKHRRDVSTPRLGFPRGSRDRGAPLNMTGAGGDAGCWLTRHILLRDHFELNPGQTVPAGRMGAAVNQKQNGRQPKSPAVLCNPTPAYLPTMS